MINNAGVAVSKNVLEMPLEDFEWLMGINFWGVVYGTYAFLPTLIESGDGHLVNISSLFGLLAVPTQSAYNAAKFGVRGFTEALRQEMMVAKAPIQVHCVHPGGGQDEHRPLGSGRRGSPRTSWGAALTRSPR